jgi:hypothetical protein
MSRMRSDEAERHRQAIIVFAEHLQELLGKCKPEQTSGLSPYPRWVPKRGCDQRANELYLTLSALTGPAADAVESVGVMIGFKPSGTMNHYPMNPVAAWPTLFTDQPMINVEYLFGSCNQALGRLSAEAERARSVEGSLAGLIGRFVAFPRRVREAAGLPPEGLAGRVATGVGVLAQVLIGLFVTVAGGLLLILAGKWLGLGN